MNCTRTRLSPGYSVRICVRLLIADFLINATISTSQHGSFGTSATARLLIYPKDSFAWSFYVIPDNQTNSFKVFISNLQSVYGLDPLSDVIYFAYSTSIF